MLNYIWCALILISIISAVVTGNTSQLGDAAISSAQDAVELVIGMCGTVCLWSGLMAVAQASGAARFITKLLSPLLKKLFPELDKDTEAFQAISANVTANLLGLGNAATPLGLKAMRCLAKENTVGLSGHTNKNMTTFVLLNTASIQLIPTMVLSILAANGAENAGAIIPCVWISSAVGLCTALLAQRVLGVRGAKKVALSKSSPHK